MDKQEKDFKLNMEQQKNIHTENLEKIKIEKK